MWRCAGVQQHSGRVCALACLLACRSKARRVFSGAEATTRMCARAALRSQDVRSVARTMALISCVTCDLCVGVMYGIVTLIGRQKGMLSCEAIRCISRFRIAALAKSRFTRAMCACRSVVCSCLVCCAPGFACPAEGNAGAVSLRHHFWTVCHQDRSL